MVRDYASLSVAQYYLRGRTMAQIGINCGGRPVLRVYGVKAQLEELDAPFSLDYAGERQRPSRILFCKPWGRDQAHLEIQRQCDPGMA